MAKLSAGLLMCRRSEAGIEVLLVHPGGPLWANKDLGAWSIPKGEYDSDEDPLDAARREFLEETGFEASGPFIPLTEVTLKGGKRVIAWAFEADCDPSLVRSNTFSLEWPPKSGVWREFPEVDRAAWFTLDEARERLNPRQVAFLDELARRIEG